MSFSTESFTSAEQHFLDDSFLLGKQGLDGDHRVGTQVDDAGKIPVHTAGLEQIDAEGRPRRITHFFG
jgi:hypothetical protein